LSSTSERAEERSSGEDDAVLLYGGEVKAGEVQREAERVVIEAVSGR
jgi:hypothetical protein